MTERSSAGPRRHANLSAGLIAAAVVSAILGFGFKAHCYVDGGWGDGEQYTTGCYTDVIPFWGERGVAEGLVPFFDTPLEYPVLTGAQIWVEGVLARALVGSDGTAFAFLAWVTVVNGALAIAMLMVMARTGVPHDRLWWWALTPAVVLYVGHNWDLLAMFCAVAAIALQRRGRALAAGVALGFGTAAKLFPGLLLPLLLLSCLRRRDLSAALRTLGGAAAAWLVVNVPVALAEPQRWAQFYTFSRERLGTFAATWTVVDELGLIGTTVEQRNLWGSALFGVGAIAIVVAGWRTHRGHEWVLATSVVAWFLLTNKVYSPQFDLWLVPLLVLTSARLWPLAAFAVADIAVYWTEFWYLARLASFTPSAPYPALAAAAGFRALVLVCIIVLGVRQCAPSWITAAPDSEERRAAATIGADSR